VLTFTEVLIKELAATNVTVTALLPGASDTDFFHKAGGEDSATYREQRLSKPENVARDGFDALMRGENRIVSGLKNKMYAAMANMMPDRTLAENMHKKMKPSEEARGRINITHGPSREERQRIDQATGGTDGDYNAHGDHIHDKE
jgi:short-subunit dehydrogenase